VARIKRIYRTSFDQLATVGVCVVPVGELECWLPDLKREPWSGKTEWLLRTFEAMGEDATDASYTQPAGGDVLGLYRTDSKMAVWTRRDWACPIK